LLLRGALRAPAGTGVAVSGDGPGHCGHGGTGGHRGGGEWRRAGPLGWWGFLWGALDGGGAQIASPAAPMSTTEIHDSAAPACRFANLPISRGIRGSAPRHTATSAAHAAPTPAHTSSRVPGSGRVIVPETFWPPSQSSRRPVSVPCTVHTAVASATTSSAASFNAAATARAPLNRAPPPPVSAAVAPGATSRVYW
jgi:hypothetical protein